MIFSEKKRTEHFFLQKSSKEIGTTVAYGRLWPPMVAYGIGISLATGPEGRPPELRPIHKPTRSTL